MKRVNFKNSVIALTIGLVMVSCGGGNAQQQQSATTETAQTTTAQTAQTAQTSEISKILSLGGLTESDIKPNGFVQFMAMDDEEFYIETTAPLGEERHKAWVKKIFDKCKQLSTDGKIYRAAYVGDNPSAYEFGDFDKRYTTSTNEWAFPYNGKYICVMVGSLVTKNSCSFNVFENK